MEIAVMEEMEDLAVVEQDDSEPRLEVEQLDRVMLEELTALAHMLEEEVAVLVGLP